MEMTQKEIARIDTEHRDQSKAYKRVTIQQQDALRDFLKTLVGEVKEAGASIQAASSPDNPTPSPWRQDISELQSQLKTLQDAMKEREKTAQDSIQQLNANIGLLSTQCQALEGKNDALQDEQKILQQKYENVIKINAELQEEQKTTKAEWAKVQNTITEQRTLTSAPGVHQEQQELRQKVRESESSIAKMGIEFGAAVASWQRLEARVAKLEAKDNYDTISMGNLIDSKLNKAELDETRERLEARLESQHTTTQERLTKTTTALHTLEAKATKERAELESKYSLVQQSYLQAETKLGELNSRLPPAAELANPEGSGLPDDAVQSLHEVMAKVQEHETKLSDFNPQEFDTIFWAYQQIVKEVKGKLTGLENADQNLDNPVEHTEQPRNHAVTATADEASRVASNVNGTDLLTVVKNLQTQTVRRVGDWVDELRGSVSQVENRVGKLEQQSCSNTAKESTEAPSAESIQSPVPKSRPQPSLDDTEARQRGATEDKLSQLAALITQSDVQIREIQAAMAVRDDSQLGERTAVTTAIGEMAMDFKTELMKVVKEVHELKASIGRLDTGLSGLEARIAELDPEQVEDTRKLANELFSQARTTDGQLQSINGRIAGLQQFSSTLQSQYHNINTEALCERMMQHLRRELPNDSVATLRQHGAQISQILSRLSEESEPKRKRIISTSTGPPTPNAQQPLNTQSPQVQGHALPSLRGSVVPMPSAQASYAQTVPPHSLAVQARNTQGVVVQAPNAQGQGDTPSTSTAPPDMTGYLSRLDNNPCAVYCILEYLRATFPFTLF
ncbi:unnamed protein product [Parascedosporium putredinis]|uniref:Uncharacterized protein n=1 Tax=Parascedosporium putredinis TaxID=1442378 RepID=A0A9P1M9A9_9PEZI|nr:unnamed protein product [Parascedosporium putredinis]CAI7990476.1 unnamed protein product [Parascedosporium putredinis]